MHPQCQTCGSFETVTACAHCPTLICASCVRNHEPLCKELQARKKRNEGPTIANVPVPQHRRGHEIPEPTPAPPIIVPPVSRGPLRAEEPQIYTEATEPPQPSVSPYVFISEEEWQKVLATARNGVPSLLNPLGIGPSDTEIKPPITVIFTPHPERATYKRIIDDAPPAPLPTEVTSVASDILADQTLFSYDVPKSVAPGQIDKQLDAIQDLLSE